ESIVTTSLARIDAATGAATNDSHTIIGRVSVAGQPAKIDEHGVTVGASAPATGIAQTINDALRQALSASGAQIVLLPATKRTSTSAAGATSAGQAGGITYSGLVGNAQIPGPLNAVSTAVQLGQAGTVASASRDTGGP